MINVDGIARELFAIRENRNNRDLLITLRFSSFSGGTLGPYDDTLAQRFSVHNSPGSSGFTVTHLTDRVGGKGTRVSAFVRPESWGFVWVVFGYTCTRLNHDHFNARPSPKDTVIDLGSYNPRVGTLVYFVVVTDKAATESISVGPPFNQVVREFGNFDAVVLHTFMMAPSIDQGQMSVVGTNYPTIDGVKPEKDFGDGSWSEDPETLRERLIDLCRKMGAGHVAQTLAAYTNLSADTREQVIKRAGLYAARAD